MPDNKFINCKDASYLISKKQEASITPEEEGLVKTHLEICPTCTLFNEQTNLLTSLLHKKSSNQEDMNTLSQEAKDRIEKELGKG